MAEIWLMLAAVIYVFQGVDSQGCISIEAAGIEAVGYNGSSGTWSVGIGEIQYNIRWKNCSQDYTLNVSWTEDYDGKTPKVNGTIYSTDSITNNSWHLTLSNHSRNFSLLRLVSKEMNDSFLIVHGAGLKIPPKNITFGHCNPKKKWGEEKEGKEVCQIKSSCGDGKPVNGSKNMRCGNFTNWIYEGCEREYVFNLKSAALNRDPNLEVPQGMNMTLDCEQSNITLPDGTTDGEHATLVAKFEYHGKTISCDGYNGTLNVLSVPHFQNKSGKRLEAAVGEEFNLRILFYANPSVPYSNISVTDSEGNLKEFYFRRSKISHEVSIYFPQVSEMSYRNYTITVAGENETCHLNKASIVVEVTKGAGVLTPGWIATICVGAFAFLLFIGLIVASVVACRRRGKQEGDSDMVLVDMQNNKPRNSHSANQNRPVPALPTTSQNHVNTSYNGYDDDEFDDDYENMDKKSSPVSERPPMPLPPSAHDGGGRPNPARSPRHSPRLGYEQPRTGVPQPRSVGPPRANQGLIPQQPNREASLSVSPDWTSRGGPRSPSYGQDYPNDPRSTMTLPMQPRRRYDEPPVSSNRFR